jgi:hypothetical protein
VFEWNIPNAPRPKKTRQVKRKFKNILIISSDVKGILHKNYILVGQRVLPHTTVRFYGDCVKICEDFNLKFGDRRTGSCLTLPFH